MKLPLLILLNFGILVLNAQGWEKAYHLTYPYSEDIISNIQFISPNTGYFSTWQSFNGSSGRPAHLFMTNDAGENWEIIYTYEGTMGSGASLYYDFINERDFFIFRSYDGCLYHGRAYRDSIVAGSAFIPDIFPYVKNISHDTIIVSHFTNKHYIFMLIPGQDQESMHKIHITDNYVYMYPANIAGYDIIKGLSIISGFGAAIGKCDGIYYFYSSNETYQDWEKDTLQISENPQSIHFINRDIGFIISENSNLYRTENSGLDWQQIEIPDELAIKDLQFGSTIGYLISNDSVIAISNDYGLTWELQTIYAAHNIKGLSVVEDIAYIFDSENNIFTNNPYLSASNHTVKNNFVVLYPNPVKDKLNLLTHETINDCLIYNIHGRVIKNIPVINSTGLQIGIEHFETGTYIILLNFNSYSIARKFIKI